MQTTEARKAASQASYYKLRGKLYAAKGGRCRDCPATEGLEVHHVHTDGQNRKRCNGRYKEYRRLLEHPEEYELLCGVCHQRETMKYVRSFRSAHHLAHSA